MMKLLGAVMILIGCGGIGYIVVATSRYQERSLQQMVRALGHMECELQYRMSSLPELCNSAADVCTGCLKLVLRQLSIELQAQIIPDAPTCMHEALNKCYNVPQKLHKCLQQLGDSLGRFDLAGQLEGLATVKRYAEYELEQLRRNQDVRLRSYQTLGICAGAALVVLFL